MKCSYSERVFHAVKHIAFCIYNLRNHGVEIWIVNVPKSRCFHLKLLCFASLCHSYTLCRNHFALGVEDCVPHRKFFVKLAVNHNVYHHFSFGICDFGCCQEHSVTLFDVEMRGIGLYYAHISVYSTKECEVGVKRRHVVVLSIVYLDCYDVVAQLNLVGNIKHKWCVAAIVRSSCRLTVNPHVSNRVGRLKSQENSLACD